MGVICHRYGETPVKSSTKLNNNVIVQGDMLYPLKSLTFEFKVTLMQEV